MLNKDSITCEVAMNDGRVTGMEITTKKITEGKCTYKHEGYIYVNVDTVQTDLRADRICVHHLFQACVTHSKSTCFNTVKHKVPKESSDM